VPAGWSGEALAEIERELAPHVGPMARVLVRRAARASTSASAVRHAVAASIIDFEARERFLAKAGPTRTDTAIPATDGHSQSRIKPVEGEVADGLPMQGGDVDKAAAALLPSLGPIARVVAKRCAATSKTREQFIARVLEQLTPTVDARRVQADLWRALG
jgi:serine/threonine-protein kinase